MSSFLSFTRFSLITSLCLVGTTVVHAQQIYVTSDLTLSSDVRSYDYLVGKNNASQFQTLPGTITLNVNDGAKVQGTGGYYAGITTFGNHVANITGGQVVNITGRENSIINITGGNVTHGSTAGESVLNVSAGNHYEMLSYSGTINITGGHVEQFVGRGGTINFSGGTLDRVNLDDLSKFNILGGSIGDSNNPNRGTINAAYASAISIKGGGFQGFVTLDRFSTVNVYGQNLKAEFKNSYGDANGGYAYWLVSGTLQDGSYTEFGVADYVGGYSVQASDPAQRNIRFNAVDVAPEPSALALLTVTLPLAGVLLRKSRRS